jgi:hypothetical protein
MDGKFDLLKPVEHFFDARSSEWLGAINENRPMIDCLHLDTIFAPAFAAVHPKSKFVFLRRNPEDVFISFYDKRQWNPHQFGPVFYNFDPDYRWRHAGYDLTPLHAWYIYFTEVFCEAFGRVMGDRFIEISAEKLFQKDEKEISTLLAFTGCDLPLERAKSHFGVKYNEKIDKSTLTEEGKNLVKEVFKDVYRHLQEHGSL